MTLPSANTAYQESVGANSPALRGLMVVAFSKSNSPSYLRSVELARTATAYAETDDDGKPRHFAGFDMTPAGISAALYLMQLCRGIKGYNIFVDGVSFHDTFMAEWAMKCYAESGRCRDTRAHCNKIMPSIYADVQGSHGLYLIPCAHIAHRIKLYKSHPSSPQDQIQAEAVRQSCDWCPNLHIDDFKTL